MGNPSPTLDYAVPKPHARLKKWTRRILLAVLVLAFFYATPIAVLYVAWRQEQPARGMLRRLNGTVLTEVGGPEFLARFVPSRLAWLRERVNCIHLDDSPATDEDIATLAGLKRLQSLDLRGCTSVSDAGLAHLKGLERLRFVFLAETRMTDAGLACFARARDLEQLDVSRTRVSDAGLRFLADYPKIWYLSLAGTQVTDSGMSRLAAFPQLSDVSVVETAVTDVGLTHLLDLPTLSYVDVSGTKVVRGRYLAFMKRPDVKVVQWTPVDLPITWPSDLGIESDD